MSGVEKQPEGPVVHPALIFQTSHNVRSQDSLNSPRQSLRNADSALLGHGETPMSRQGEDISRTDRAPKSLTVQAPSWVPGKVKVPATRTTTYPFITDADSRLAAYAGFTKEGHPDPELVNQEFAPPGSGTWDWLWSNPPNQMAKTSPLLQDGSYALSPQGTQPVTAPPSWHPSYKNFPVDTKEASMHGAALPILPFGFHGTYRKPESHAAPLAVNTDRSAQEISTLFMAGFPEDMTDREFSNMFLFAKGFEASMLKYPQPTKSEDDFRKPGDRHGTWSQADRDGQHSPPQQEPEQPSAKNKQIIGFAKFSTREEALQARDVLNGFRIDTDRGCILKAELAKKNLHTKRSVPFVVTKHGHPAGHAKPALSARDYPMVDPVSAAATYAAMSGRPGSYASHPPDMPSDDHTPLAPLGVHSMMDPRGSAAAWAEAMEQKHAQAAMESHGMATMTPISEMVSRLDNFSKTIPTFASQHAGTMPAISENPSTQWGRANSSPVVLSPNQAGPVHSERLRPNLTLTPLEVTQGIQNMNLGLGQGLHKSPESTMLHPLRDNSGSSTMDGSSSLSGLTHANSGTSGSEIWSLGSRSCTSPSQVHLDEYISPTTEQRPISSLQDAAPSKEVGESESK